MNDLTYKKMGRDINSLVLEASLPDRILNDEEIRDEIILLNSQVNNETDNGWYIKNTNYNIGLVFNDINTYNKFINVVNIIQKYSTNRLEKRNNAILYTPDFISFIITENIGLIKRDELKTLYETRVDYEAILYDFNDSYNETYIRALNTAFRSNIFSYVLHISDMSRQALEELEMRYKLMLKDIKSKSVIHTNTKDELYVYEFALRNAMTYTKESTEDYDEIRDLIIQIAEDLKLQKEMIDLLIQNMPELHHFVDDTDDKAVTPKAVREYVQDIITGNIDLPDNILTDENITHELGDEELKVISQKGFTEALNDVKSEVDVNTQSIGLFGDKLEEIKDDIIDVKDDVELNKLDINLNKESIKIIKEKDQKQDDKIKTIEELQIKHSSDITSLDNKIDDVEEKLQDDINTKFDKDDLHHTIDLTDDKPVTPKAVKDAIDNIDLPEDILTQSNITNELGESEDKVASQKLVNSLDQDIKALDLITQDHDERLTKVENNTDIDVDDFIKFDDIHHRVDATTDKPVSPDAVKRAIESITGGQPIPDDVLTQDVVTNELGASTELVASQKLVSNVNDKVEVNTVSIIENTNKIKSLEEKQEEYSNDLSNIDTEHKQWISDIEAEIESHKEAQSVIDTTQDEKIQSLEGDITSHSESISNLETKTNDLKSGLDKKRDREDNKFDEVCTEKLKVLSDCEGWGWYSSAIPMTIPGLFTRSQNQDYNLRFPNRRSGTFALDEDLQEGLQKKRDKTDATFNKPLQLNSSDDTGTGVFMFCPEGKPRGQMVYNSYGLQFTQVQSDGTTQTFTFPRYGEGGEILTGSVLDNTISPIEEAIDELSKMIYDLDRRLEEIEKKLN